MDTSSYQILVVDDEVDFLDVTCEHVREAGFESIAANGPKEALKLLEAHHENIVMVVSDYRMPEMNGIELRAAMLDKYLSIPFAILSGHVTRELALSGVEYKVCAFLDKPIESQQFKQMLLKETSARVSAFEEQKEIEQCYLEESEALLEELEPLLLALESDRANQNNINTVFRILHTLKGGSAVLRNDAFTGFIHSYEDVLSGIKAATLKPTDHVMSLLLETFDVLAEAFRHMRDLGRLDLDLAPVMSALKSALVNPDGEAAPTEASSDGEMAAKSSGDQVAKRQESVTVPLLMLDDFMQNSGELTVIRNMVNKVVRAIERRLPGDEDVTLLDELLEEMHKINSSMQTQITDLRKVPTSTVSRRLPRAIRDLSKSLEKKINIEIEGEDLRIDNTIAQCLTKCLVHLIRNSADHGFEMPDERVAAGKPESGLLKVSFAEKSDQVVVTIVDDGRGINPEKILKKAVEQGMIEPEDVQHWSKQEVLGLIFESGFSTAAAVTDVSGRGVGMDMVKSTVAETGGKVSIDSELGQGTQVKIAIPIPKSVVIISSLLVDSEGYTFAIPQENIERLLHVSRDRMANDIQETEGARFLTHKDQLVPISRLSDYLDLKLEKEQVNEEATIVIVRSEQGVAAVEVDRIRDSEDIVVKALHPALELVGVYGGATFLGDGSIGLILEPDHMVATLGVKNSIGLFAGQEDAERKGFEGAEGYLLFDLNSKTRLGMPLEHVQRLEEIRRDAIQFYGSQKVALYRDQTIPLVSLAESLHLAEDFQDSQEVLPMLVVKDSDHLYGFLISRIADLISGQSIFDQSIRDRAGIAGNVLLPEATIPVVDVKALVRAFESQRASARSKLCG